MQRQQRLRLGDANALRASWARFTDDQRKQVIAIFAELIARAVRAAHKKEQHDAAGK
jgi:predicted Fe-S protein YdhL (DUF1289 family)